MPEGLQGKSTHSGRAPAGAQSCRFETLRGTPDCIDLFFQRSRWYEIRRMIRIAIRPVARRYLPRFLQRVAAFAPIADSAVHRDDVGVSHFLQVVGGQRGTETAATIEDERNFEIGILSLNVAFNDAFAKVDGSGQVVGVEFAVFADVDENKFLAAIEPGFDFVNVGFADALLGVLHNLQKARWMVLSHGRRFSTPE